MLEHSGAAPWCEVLCHPHLWTASGQAACSYAVDVRCGACVLLPTVSRPTNCK